jgi:hypothetical protein
MKKITVLAVALLAISFASCKKERTCSCTVAVTEVQTEVEDGDSDIQTNAYTGTINYKMEKISKVGANGACASGKTVDKNTISLGTNHTLTTETTTDADCKLD